MNKNNKFLFIHTHIFVFFIFYFFGVGPSSAHVGWAGPGWAKIKESTREVLSRVHEQNRGIKLECVN
jgi:hypothetical protein